MARQYLYLNGEQIPLNGQDFWVGTHAEFENANPPIPKGTLLYFTDGEEDKAYDVPFTVASGFTAKVRAYRYRNMVTVEGYANGTFTAKTTTNLLTGLPTPDGNYAYQGSCGSENTYGYCYVELDGTFKAVLHDGSSQTPRFCYQYITND